GLPVGGGPGGPPPGGPGGPGKFGGLPRFGVILSPFMQDILKMSAAQKKQLESYQKEVSTGLQKILTDEQNKRLAETKPGFAPDGIGMPPPPGQILSPFNQARLKLTEPQKRQLEQLQKDTDSRLGKILTEEQHKQLKGMQAWAFGPPGGFRPGGAGGFP